MKQRPSYLSLSPIGTDEYPCFGAHHVFRSRDYKEKPYAFALKVGIIDNMTMLVKIPISEEQSRLAEMLRNEFNTSYPVSVKFINLCCYYYEYGNNTGFTATAESFIIQEE